MNPGCRLASFPSRETLEGLLEGLSPTRLDYGRRLVYAIAGI